MIVDVFNDCSLHMALLSMSIFEVKVNRKSLCHTQHENDMSNTTSFSSLYLLLNSDSRNKLVCWASKKQTDFLQSATFRLWKADDDKNDPKDATRCVQSESTVDS